MKVQQVNNQQSFGATGRFFPARLPESFETLLKPEIPVSTFRDFSKSLDCVHVGRVLHNLLEAIKAGKVARSEKDIVFIPQVYKERSRFELNGDVITLGTKPFSNELLKSSTILIGHGENGKGGMIAIHRDLSAKPEDIEFNTVANALNSID